MDKSKKVFWCFPWGYRESVAISLGILFCGMLIDLFTKNSVPLLKSPYNIFAGVIFVLSLILLFVINKDKEIVKWLNSYYASIPSVCLFGIVSIGIALIPQNTKANFFIYNLTSSYTYFFAYLFLLIVLGMVVLKRLIPLRKKNIGFLFSHFGLWIALFAAGIGYGDMQKLTMYLTEGETVWYAIDKDNEQVELSLALKLNNFDIEEYNSKVAIIDNSTGEIVKEKGKPYVVEIVRDKFLQILNYNLKIKKYYKYSVFAGGEFKPVITQGAVSSAMVEIADKKKWICSAGIKGFPKTLKINNKHSLVLLKPEPKRFFSNVTVYEKDGNIHNEIIQVNKPITVKGWKIYQNSYDKTKGKWSELSIVELVKDPWLSMVYLGCIMIILGAFYMIWRGRRINFKVY
jgi:NADH:ubiquinone oxidoreductase subunit 6 (subunit J)